MREFGRSGREYRRRRLPSQETNPVAGFPGHTYNPHSAAFWPEVQLPHSFSDDSSSNATIMPDARRQIAVLGSTGSIGRSTFDVLRTHGDRLAAFALSSHRNLDRLCEQARELAPRYVVAADSEAAADYRWQLPGGVEVLTGEEGLMRVASHPEVDVVLAAIVGRAGLAGAWAALEAGKTLALANKETLVIAGSLAMPLAERTGATILPVDSEHSAVFQALRSGRREEVSRIVLTASGGPFRGYTKDQLANVTVEQALAHPTWRMGPKITIDSATMMNKALDIIEAKWLFGLDAEQIEVVVHPQSIVHSMVEFIDGAVIAQLSPPDMKLPIQYALTYPERWPGCAARFPVAQSCTLQFDPPDEELFPALRLGKEVARVGGTAGAVLNAANEAAVQLFLDRRLRFPDIAAGCQAVLESHTFDPSPTLDGLLALDRWARQEMNRWTSHRTS
jgi:1-deoxy-D-xylulose-5-phosphate reductoisomerase